MLSINTPSEASTALAALGRSQRAIAEVTERLATGARMTSAGDDAARLALANHLQTRVGSIGVAQRNIQDALGVLQTADSALGEISNLLQRMRELTVQAGSDALNDVQRTLLDAEFSAARAAAQAIASDTRWNGHTLLDGQFRRNIQVGSEIGETKTLSLGGVDITQWLTAGSTTGAAGAGGGSVVTSTTPAPTVLSGAGSIQGLAIFTHDYDLINIDTRAYTAGGTIAITVSIGPGLSRSSIDLYKNGVTTGGAQNQPLNSLSNAYDVLAGSTVNLSYNFPGSSTDQYVLGIEGSWLSLPLATNTYTYSVTVTGNPITTSVAGSPAGSAASGSTLNLLSASGAREGLAILDSALLNVASLRSSVGEQINAFVHMADQAATQQVQLTGSRSVLADADMAHEMAELSRNMILENAAAAVLSQSLSSRRTAIEMLSQFGR